MHLSTLISILTLFWFIKTSVFQFKSHLVAKVKYFRELLTDCKPGSEQHKQLLNQIDTIDTQLIKGLRLQDPHTRNLFNSSKCELSRTQFWLLRNFLSFTSNGLLKGFNWGNALVLVVMIVAIIILTICTYAPKSHLGHVLYLSDQIFSILSAIAFIVFLFGAIWNYKKIMHLRGESF